VGPEEKWDLCTHILAEHTGEVNSVSISPDGSRLAS
jgi:WD40 repeat protein